MRRRAIHTAVRTPAALARGGPDDLAEARASRDLLLASARVLVGVVAHDPDRADCTDAGCALAGDPDRARCGLVHRLARVEAERSVGAGGPPAPTPLGLEAATRVFESALTDAVEAIRRCRQTQHGTGHCWFTEVRHVDGCGELLRTVHRLG